MNENNASRQGPRVGLFVTCLADLFRPNVAFAAVKLMEEAGCTVEVPRAQTCCGQPAYNSGDLKDTQVIAKQVIEAFDGFDYVVAPSGSCAGMLKVHYPHLLADDPDWYPKAEEFATRVHELVSFLTDVLGVKEVTARYDGKATYHDSCSNLREMDVEQPRKLLESVEGLELSEMKDTDVCCGFGGTFCVKFPEISTRMVSDKVARIEETGADTLLAGDLGCLLNISGRLKRLDKPVKVYHVAEILANMADVPGMGDGEQS